MTEIRVRVDIVTCPKCKSGLTKIINKVDGICLNCGVWFDPQNSPSVIRERERVLREAIRQADKELRRHG